MEHQTIKPYYGPRNRSLSLSSPSPSSIPSLWPVKRQSRVDSGPRQQYEDHPESAACPKCNHTFLLDRQAESPRSRRLDIPPWSIVQRRSPSTVSDVSTRPYSSRASSLASYSSSHTSYSSYHTSTTPNFLVCGGTGVGKSLFIRLLSNESGRRAKVGSELMSCTSRVESFPCTVPDRPQFNLIDSPGFDDSRMPDAEVLTMLAKFILDLYDRGQEVHGVIFIHRITDVRLSGSLVKTAQIIRRITGERFRGRFALVTSMWDRVEDKEVACNRESELMRHPQFWKEFVPHDRQRFRFSGTEKSARRVIRWFLDSKTFLESPPQLQLYTQLMAGKLVSETDAGVFVMGELSKQRQKHLDAVEQLRREISQARQERDGEAVKIYSQMQAREEASIRQTDMMRRKMRRPAFKSQKEILARLTP